MTPTLLQRWLLSMRRGSRAAVLGLAVAGMAMLPVTARSTPAHGSEKAAPASTVTAKAASAHAAAPAPSHAAAPAHGAAPQAAQHAGAAPAATDGAEQVHRVANKIKAAFESHAGPKGGVALLIGDKPPAAAPAHGTALAAAHGSAQPVRNPRDHSRARAAIQQGHAAPEAHGGKAHEPHWAYEGEYGPQNWARVKPGFNLCAIGKRQSPVHIEEPATLQGPATPLQFDYRPSGGSVVNNGHTIQVDLEPGNTLTVRGSTYQLLQFHFHHPAEEKLNHKGFAMVAHLVHRNAEGQLAVVAVLIDPGAANPLIHKVWTHMPLDSGDRVPLPAGLIDLSELLPQDQRYYQFMGSLTTPPCTEGVLWNVLKTPVTLSKDQLRLFARLFPMNARPVQALNGRVVREAE